jgi:hypothetical protein
MSYLTGFGRWCNIFIVGHFVVMGIGIAALCFSVAMQGIAVSAKVSGIWEN